MGPTILIIEDNEQNSYLERYILEKKGCAVVCAPDGLTGLSMAENESPDVILLDIQLPGMDGYEVAKRLRACPACASVPIIAVTSYAMAGDRERILAAGADDYMEKPIDPSSFAERVLAQVPAAKGGLKDA
jgi:CheY-like chemotaxis protein